MMHPKQREAMTRAMHTLIAFHKKKTPGGAEYARRMRIAIAFIIRGDFAQARKWVLLCDVPEEQG